MGNYKMETIENRIHENQAVLPLGEEYTELTTDQKAQMLFQEHAEVQLQKCIHSIGMAAKEYSINLDVKSWIRENLS